MVSLNEEIAQQSENVAVLALGLRSFSKDVSTRGSPAAERGGKHVHLRQTRTLPINHQETANRFRACNLSELNRTLVLSGQRK